MLLRRRGAQHQLGQQCVGAVGLRIGTGAVYVGRVVGALVVERFAMTLVG